MEQAVTEIAMRKALFDGQSVFTFAFWARR